MEVFERVYEIGTVFRNEGISAHHNPEFTLLEYYTAYDNFEAGLDKFKLLIARASDDEITYESWSTMTMREAVENYTGSDIDDWVHDLDFAEKVEEVMKKYVEPNLTSPTIITHHPACISPLARSTNGVYAERFEAYIAGMEIANGFCEQTNPQAQLKAFEEQNAKLGNPIDHDFIYALSSGCPPVFGVGVGIDRLAMVLSDAKHIKEVICFPYTRPIKES